MQPESRTPRHSRAVVLAAGLNGLGAVRSLASKGIASVVVSRSTRDPAFRSRLPVRKVIIPAEAPLTDWLAQFVRSAATETDCIIPTSDEFAEALRALAPEDQFILPFALPPRQLVDSLNDKRLEIELVRATGIALPPSLLDLAQFQEAPLRFPVIVKPRSYRAYQILGAKNRIISDFGAWKQFGDEFAGRLDAFIAQEIIPGDESYQWVCNATFDNIGTMVSAFSFQRLGTRPARYGVTSLAISQHNAFVKDSCARLGSALGYIGPAMFEFKIDPRSGQYLYIETNPRLGMCNWFDTSCGVNNVYNAYALATGLPMETNVVNQVDGVLFVDFFHDLYARLKSGQRIRDILGLYSRLPFDQVVPPLWVWRDVRPGLAGTGEFLASVMQRLGRKARAGIRGTLRHLQ